jgi:hypothetical protein
MKPKAAPKPALAREKTAEWVYGWKAANWLINAYTGEIKFAPMFQRLGSNDPLGKAEPYGVKAEAKCQYHWHKPPHRPDCWCQCKCGFYAVDPNHREEAMDYMRQDIKRGDVMVTANPVLLYVGLKGLTYQGDKPNSDVRVSRGATQHITAVYVPKNCAGEDCFGEPVAVGKLGPDPRSKRQQDYKYLRPLCPDHLSPGSLTLDRCAKRLEIPVSWHNPLTRVI